MSSLLDVRVGVQEPAILHQPPDVHSLAAAEEAIELADAYGVCDGFPLAESQRITLRAALGERADGSWAASRVGDFGPRQGTGKSDKIAVRELAGLILFDEQLIIHTAHEFPTANESFLRLVSVFENWDDLRKKVARIRYANGEQGIELLTGQRLKYRARTGGSGRGFAKADLIVYDEAQHLAREHVAASGPAKMANPNSQTWYAGSGGLATSSLAWGLRKDAVLGRGGRLAYTEATAETVRVVDGRIFTEAPDPLDVDAWYRAIPGLGRWITEEAVRAQLEELGPEAFARECLCVWDDELSDGAGVTLPFDKWISLSNPDAPAPRPPVMFAVDMNPSRTSTAIAAVGEGRSGEPQVEMVAVERGSEWVVAKCLELQAKHKPLGFVVDQRSPAGSLIADMKDAGLDPIVPNTVEVTQACGSFHDAVVAGMVRHVNDAALNQAVRNAGTRPVGDAWAWARRGSGGDISPLVAATLALWGWSTRHNTIRAIDLNVW